MPRITSTFPSWHANSWTWRRLGRDRSHARPDSRRCRLRYQIVRRARRFRIDRSEVISVRSWVRAVAAIKQSAGSRGNESPSCSDSIATSTVSGSTSSSGDDAAARNYNGHGRKRGATTTRPCARCHAASFSEMAASPTRSCAEAVLSAARARRLKRGWSSTDQSHACVSKRYFTRDPETRPRLARSVARCHRESPRCRRDNQSAPRHGPSRP